MLHWGLYLCAFAVPSIATRLYVSSYAGTVTSIELSKSDLGTYAFRQVAVNTASRTAPSWLTKNKFNGVLYSLDEGFSGPNGSITSFRTTASGELAQISTSLPVISGPVSSVVFNGGKALAVAHYGGSSVSTYNILPSGGLSFMQSFTFKLSKPGTVPSRQDAPHPHQVILDPTGCFIIVPDLGADLLRIFIIDSKNGKITESAPLAITAGAGPRHGCFSQSGSETYFFLVAELDNIVRSYKVTYGLDLIVFKEVFKSSMFGSAAPPVGAAAAEVLVSPDGNFLLTSSRNATLFQIPNFDSTNDTKIPSDTLQSWRIDYDSGELAFVQLAPAGGSFPRQFSTNKNGTLAAVGLQSDSKVVIVQRDVEMGTYGDFVAEISIAGQITSVIWDE